MAANKKVLIGLGVFLAAVGTYWAYNKKTAIENLSILVNNIKLSFKGAALQANIDLLVKNPTSELLQFKSFTGAIFSDKQQLGTIDIAKPVNLNPKSSTIVPLSTVLPVSNLANTFLSLITSRQLPTKGTLKGVVTLSGGLSVPVNYVFDFTSPVPATK
jgi:LEA14-like dessication related protein